MHKNKIYLLIIVVLIAILGYQIWNISTRGYQDMAAAQMSSNRTDEVVLYKNPGCQCCSRWAAKMEKAGFEVTEKPTDRLPAVKVEKGIPNNMAACHTAIVGGYVVEGHVPIKDVQRLLREKPHVRGIAVPGMPAGSPGMESAQPEAYTVYLINNDGGTKVYDTITP